MTRKEQVNHETAKRFTDPYDTSSVMFELGVSWADDNPDPDYCGAVRKLDIALKALNTISILQSGAGDYTVDFFEQTKWIVRDALSKTSTP